MASEHCGSCGAAFVKEAARFCGACGAPRVQSVAANLGASPVPAPPPQAAGSAVRANRNHIGGIPAELWLVVAAFAVPGAWLLLGALRALPDDLDLIGGSFLGWRFGLIITLLVVLVGLLGAAMLVIAWMLYRADRVGRGIAYVVAGTVALSVLFSNDRSNAQIAALIGSLAAVGILVAAPNVQALFTGSAARQRDAPTSVIVCRTVLLLFEAISVVVALVYLVLGTFQARWLIVAALLAAMVVASHTRSLRLMRADVRARQEISVGAAVLIVLLVIFGKHSTGLLIPIGLLAGAVGCLWLASDARQFFDAGVPSPASQHLPMLEK